MTSGRFAQQSVEDEPKVKMTAEEVEAASKIHFK